uniref:Uncharacterized protein n=1 Tax=Knipowitschia caucasica TaxID=637954 RepID=A0AAV2MHD4_KNICA
MFPELSSLLKRFHIAFAFRCPLQTSALSSALPRLLHLSMGSILTLQLLPVPVRGRPSLDVPQWGAGVLMQSGGLGVSHSARFNTCLIRVHAPQIPHNLGALKANRSRQSLFSRIFIDAYMGL